MSGTNYVDFRAVKQAVSILQILDHYNLKSQFRQNPNGDSLSGPCPLHNGKNPTQFRVSIKKNCWNCFGDCKSGGNILDFVSRRESCTIREAAILITEWFGISRQEPVSRECETQPRRGSDKDSRQSRRRLQSPEQPEEGGNKPLGFELTRLDAEHPYLTDRGLTPNTVALFGLGFCESGSMAGRIVIPIHNLEGKIVAYAGRWPGDPPDETPKYKLPVGFRKSLEIFNLHRAKRCGDEQPLVIVEGFFDCMNLVQSGYERTVALMGSTLSSAQGELLRGHTTSDTRIVLMLDEDDAGRQARADMVQWLAIQRFVKIVPLFEQGSQPDDLTADDLARLL